MLQFKPKNPMIVDCHVHLNNYHKATREPTDTHSQRLLGEMDEHGVAQALILSSYVVNTDRPSTASILELTRNEPRLHVIEGVGVTDEENYPDWEMIGTRLREGLTKGLKIYPGYEHVYPYDKQFFPAYELAEKYRVPVMIHTGDTYAPQGKLKYAHPIHVDEVAVDWPNTNFVVCHLGNPWLRDTSEVTYKNHNVYADISGLVLEEFDAPLEEHMREEVEDFLLYSGEMDKLLYGTDWPLVKMGPYLRFVNQLGLDEEFKQMLLWKNATRLFRLPSPAEPGNPLHDHERPRRERESSKGSDAA